MLLEFETAYCYHCKWFEVDANQPGKVSTCKRLDHKKYCFYTPWFRCYDCGEYNHLICSDFDPKPCFKVQFSTYPGFENYYAWYRQTFHKYLNRPLIIPLCLDGDFTVCFQVPYILFAYNRHIDKDGNLRWVHKMFYKRTRKSPIGYELITEHSERAFKYGV